MWQSLVAPQYAADRCVSCGVLERSTVRWVNGDESSTVMWMLCWGVQYSQVCDVLVGEDQRRQVYSWAESLGALEAEAAGLAASHIAVEGLQVQKGSWRHAE